MNRSRSISHQPFLVLAMAAIAAACGASTPTATPTGPNPTSPPSTATAAASGAPATPGQTSGATGPTGAPATATAPAGPIEPPVIPEPPHAAASPAGSVDEQAAALAVAVAQGGQTALAPLLTAYHLAGMPVIGNAGESLVGDPEDPVGLPYWMVWLSAGSNPNISLPLADALRLLSAMPDAPDFDTAAVAVAALADVREMANADDPQQHFFGRFLVALAAAAGADPLDPQVTAEDVMLNSIATTYLMAGVLRGVVTEAARANPQARLSSNVLLASTGNSMFDTPMAPVAQATASSPCNFTGIPEQIIFWAQFIASRLAGGLQLPGMQGPMRSLVQLLSGSSALSGTITTAASWASGIVSALALLIQATHIEVEIDVQPVLERTHASGSDGKFATLRAHVRYDLEGSSLDGGQGIRNCLALLLTGLGYQVSLPSNGDLSGASVKFEAGQGFGDFVHFKDVTRTTVDTDSGGIATIDIMGLHQKKDLPFDAPEWDREATVRVHSSAGAINERTIVSTFINGLLAIPSGGATAISALADVLSTIKWDYGEQSFLVIDWSHGWFVDQASGGGRIEGIKCYDASAHARDSMDGQWVMHGTYKQTTAQGEQNGVEIWTVTINPGGSTGTYTYTDTAILETFGGITVYVDGKAEGNADVTLMDDGSVSMHTVDTKHSFNAHTDFGGKGSDTPAPLRAGIVIWNPGADCP